jgi:hypothetical protein
MGEEKQIPETGCPVPVANKTKTRGAKQVASHWPTILAENSRYMMPEAESVLHVNCGLFVRGDHFIPETLPFHS